MPVENTVPQRCLFGCFAVFRAADGTLFYPLAGFVFLPRNCLGTAAELPRNGLGTVESSGDDTDGGSFFAPRPAGTVLVMPEGMRLQPGDGVSMSGRRAFILVHPALFRAPVTAVAAVFAV